MVSLNGNVKWGIYDRDGHLDYDDSGVEPMVFDSYERAVEVLYSDAYESPEGYTIRMTYLTYGDAQDEEDERWRRS